MLPLLILANAIISALLVLVLSLAEAYDMRVVVAFLSGFSQSFLVYRDNIGAGPRGYWADKGCAYFGLFWLFGAYCRRYHWWALPRFLLVLTMMLLGELMLLGAASI